MNNLMQRTYFTMEDCYVNLAVELEREIHGRELSSLLENRFNDNWIIFVDGHIEDVEDFPFLDDKVIEKRDRWLRRFRFVYESTKDKYNALLGLYEANASKLMDQLKTKSTARFNDTPQNGGDYSADPYTTNITQSTIETDNEDVMSRLIKIQDNYRDLLRDWTDEFVRLFGEEL